MMPWSTISFQFCVSFSGPLSILLQVAEFFCEALLRCDTTHSAELAGVALRVCDRVRYFMDREDREYYRVAYSCNVSTPLRSRKAVRSAHKNACTYTRQNASEIRAIVEFGFSTKEVKATGTLNAH